MSETPNQDECHGTLVRGSDGVLFCPDCGWRVEPGSPKYRTPKPTALETKDAEIASLRAQLDGAKAKSNWKCKAPGYFGDQDCDWPNCGCDPHAERVISGLREHGFMDPDTVKEFEAETRDEARRKAIDQCAAIADERAAICADAVAKIKAGELYKETAKTSVQTENCARLEAVHIAELIRALLSESKT